MKRDYHDVLKLKEHYIALGQTRVSLYQEWGEEIVWSMYPWEYITEVRPPQYTKGAVPNDPYFIAEIDGIEFQWSIRISDRGRESKRLFSMRNIMLCFDYVPEKFKHVLYEAYQNMLPQLSERANEAFDYYSAIARDESEMRTILNAIKRGSL